MVCYGISGVVNQSSLFSSMTVKSSGFQISLPFSWFSQAYINFTFILRQLKAIIIIILGQQQKLYVLGSKIGCTCILILFGLFYFSQHPYYPRAWQRLQEVQILICHSNKRHKIRVRELYGNFFVFGLVSNKVSSMLIVIVFFFCLLVVVVVGGALDKNLGTGEPLRL